MVGMKKGEAAIDISPKVVELTKLQTVSGSVLPLDPNSYAAQSALTIFK
jgi:hypothetical protein